MPAKREFVTHTRLGFKSIKEVVDFLNKNGIKLDEIEYLGRGAFGQAFKSPKTDQVIKITTDEQEIEFYTNLHKNKKNLKYLVNIHRIYNLSGSTYIIVMEALEPIKDTPVYKDLTRLGYDFILNYTATFFYLADYEMKDIMSHFIYTYNMEEKYPDILESLEIIRKRFGDITLNALIESIGNASQVAGMRIIRSFVALYANHPKFFEDFINMLRELRENDMLNNDIKPNHIMYSKKDKIYKIIDPR